MRCIILQFKHFKVNKIKTLKLLLDLKMLSTVQTLALLNALLFTYQADSKSTKSEHADSKHVSISDSIPSGKYL